MTFLIKNILVDLQNQILLACTTSKFLKNENVHNFVRLGSTYGGWWVPKFFLAKNPADLTVVSVGLGTDVSFDKEVLKLGGQIVGLDPIPSSIIYANQELADFEACTLINKGLWVESGTQFFTPPIVDGYASWQITTQKNRNDLLELQVMTIEEISAQFLDQKSKKFVMLKMDIEGAELHILQNVANTWGDFDLIAVEMDFLAKIPFIQLRKRMVNFFHSQGILRKMDELQFTLVKVENFNFYWLKNIYLS